MRCGVLDFGCELHKVLDPIWFWLSLGFWVVVALVVLGILYRVKQVFGWQGVVAALAAAGGVIIAIFSFKAGRDSVSPRTIEKPKKPKPILPVNPRGPQPPDIWNQPPQDRGKKKKH